MKQQPPRTLFLMAASVAAAVIGLVYWAQSGFQLSPHEQVKAFVTPIAQQRVIKLPDGSVVTLGARTGIQTEITALERTIVLDRGEAWFDVTHESARPFKVIAGNGVITALGTAFNVRRDRDTDGDRVTVTVGAGAVKVEPRELTAPRISLKTVFAQAHEWKTARLAKGQELTYDGAGQRGDVKVADVEAAAAWKEGRLEYIHQPLKTVVARVNRYSEKPIVLADDSVGELDYSGTVFEGQLHDWLRALQTAFPVSVQENEHRIVVQARKP